MNFNYHVTTSKSFDHVLEQLPEALKAEGFGIITQIDMKETLKTKIGAEIRPYKILGACNPKYAYEALQQESRIGVLLPCNIIVQQLATGETEIAAINPEATISSMGKQELQHFAEQVGQALQRVLQAVK